MAHFVTRIKTDKPQSEVFDYMADLRNFSDWDPGVSSAKLIEGDGPAEGSAFELVASGTTLTYVLVEYDPPKRVVAEANSARLRSYDVIEVEADGDGSILTYDATLEAKGVFKLFSPALALAFGWITAKADRGMQEALNGTKVS